MTSRSMMHRHPQTPNIHTQQGGKGPYKSPGSSAYNAQNYVQASRRAVNLARAAAHCALAKATENNNTHRPGVGISVPAFKLTRRHQGLRPPVTNATAWAHQAQYTPLVMKHNGTASVELPLEDGGGSGGRPPRTAPMVQPAKSRSVLSHRGSMRSPGPGAHGRRVRGLILKDLPWHPAEERGRNHLKPPLEPSRSKKQRHTYS